VILISGRETTEERESFQSSSYRATRITVYLKMGQNAKCSVIESHKEGLTLNMPPAGSFVNYGIRS